MENTNVSFQSISYRIQGSIIIVINAATVVAILSLTKLRQSYSNIFLCNLLLTHIFIGIEEIFDSFTSDLQEDHIIQIIDGNAYNALYLSQCLNLVILTIDRLIAIRWPYTYLLLNRRKTVLITITTWVLLAISMISLIFLRLKRELQLLIRAVLTVFVCDCFLICMQYYCLPYSPETR